MVTTYEYDGLDRLTRLRDAKGAVVIADNVYAYNAGNQIAQIAGTSGTRNFSYDAVDRLIGVSGANTEEYSYDAVGNRTASHLSATHSYQPFNRLTGTDSLSFVYDKRQQRKNNGP